jgi:hypothetical protein
MNETSNDVINVHDENHIISSTSKVYGKHEVIDYESDTDHIEDVDNQYIDKDKYLEAQAHTTTIPKRIYGPPNMILQLTALCVEFQDSFSHYVLSEPAMVEPMQMTVNDTEWYKNKANEWKKNLTTTASRDQKKTNRPHG